MAWNDGIDGSALEIAASSESTLLVVAGPGTGKTFALMRRVARLLEDGTDPKRILLVTFTRTAAADLEKGLNQLAIGNSRFIRKGTLHSFCFSLLGSANVFLQIGRVPRPLLVFEERFHLEDLKNNGDFGTIPQCKKRLHAFEAAWAREQDQQPGWALDDQDREFETALRNWLRFHDAMLLSELVPETLKYLRNNPGCVELQQYTHVLVDEYQDLNRAEQSVIDLLSKRGSLTVIGDEDQSIYEAFRYAHPEGIIEFVETHAQTREIPLTLCRRCPTKVVNLAKELISYNTLRKGRSLLPRAENIEGEVHIVQWADMDSEAAGIAKFIDSRIKRGDFEPGQVLVLCPRRQFGYKIRDALRNLDQPAHSFFHEELLDGNPKLVEDNRAQEAFTLLRLLVAPNDKVALRCWLGLSHTKLRVNEYARLQTYCSRNNVHPRDALETLLSGGELPIPRISVLVERYALLKQRSEELRDESCQAIIDGIFPEGEEWAEPFREAVGELSDSADLKDVFDTILTNVSQPEMPTDVEYIRIMSLHKSKGLTADHVIVVGCVESAIPSRPDDTLSLDDQQRYREEQRRLFYVAITRPRRTLVLSSVLNIPYALAKKMNVEVTRGNSGRNTITSTFIQELGPQCPSPIFGDEWRY